MVSSVFISCLLVFHPLAFLLVLSFGHPLRLRIFAGRELGTRRPGTGVSWALQARSAPESVRPGARRAVETPRGTLHRTPPIFRDTLSDNLRDTSGPKGPKDSFAWPASSQVESFIGPFGIALASSLRCLPNEAPTPALPISC